MITASSKEQVEQLVEIQLTYDATAYFPCPYNPDLNKYPHLKDKVGTLTFQQKDCNPYGTSIKVKVPVSATTSQQALEEHFKEAFEGCYAEYIEFDNLNIWVPDESNPADGDFKFNLYE